MPKGLSDATLYCSESVSRLVQADVIQVIKVTGDNHAIGAYMEISDQQEIITGSWICDARIVHISSWPIEASRLAPVPDNGA